MQILFSLFRYGGGRAETELTANNNAERKYKSLYYGALWEMSEQLSLGTGYILFLCLSGIGTKDGENGLLNYRFWDWDWYKNQWHKFEGAMSERKNPDMIVTKSEQDSLKSKKENLDSLKCNVVGNSCRDGIIVTYLFVCSRIFSDSFIERRQAVKI